LTPFLLLCFLVSFTVLPSIFRKTEIAHFRILFYFLTSVSHIVPHFCIRLKSSLHPCLIFIFYAFSPFCMQMLLSSSFSSIVFSIYPMNSSRCCCIDPSIWGTCVCMNICTCLKFCVSQTFMKQFYIFTHSNLKAFFL
jgi:hypothetical protein